jgi:hypothetical protein
MPAIRSEIRFYAGGIDSALTPTYEPLPRHTGRETFTPVMPYAHYVESAWRTPAPARPRRPRLVSITCGYCDAVAQIVEGLVHRFDLPRKPHGTTRAYGVCTDCASELVKPHRAELVTPWGKASMFFLPNEIVLDFIA